MRMKMQFQKFIFWLYFCNISVHWFGTHCSIKYQYHMSIVTHSSYRQIIFNKQLYSHTQKKIDDQCAHVSTTNWAAFYYRVHIWEHILHTLLPNHECAHRFFCVCVSYTTLLDCTVIKWTDIKVQCGSLNTWLFFKLNVMCQIK